MSSVNSAHIVGRIGRDPELKFSGSGTAVLKFSVATTEKYKDKEETDWHNVVIFGKMAENLKFLEKGHLVYVDGRIKNDSYEKDGVKQYRSSIIADKVQCLTPRGASNGGQRVQEREPGQDDDDQLQGW